jgi:hypothetical protein
MEDQLNKLAMRIFVQMAAQHTVRHGLHDSRGQASSLARESFMLAEAFAAERAARDARSDEGGELTSPAVQAP